MDWLRRFQTGDIDRTQLTVAFNAQLTPEAVKLTKEKLSELGRIVGSTFRSQSYSHGMHGYQFDVEFARAKYVYLFDIDSQGNVAGFFLSPLK